MSRVHLYRLTAPPLTSELGQDNICFFSGGGEEYFTEMWDSLAGSLVRLRDIGLFHGVMTGR